MAIDQVSRAAALAMKRGKSVDFTGYLPAAHYHYRTRLGARSVKPPPCRTALIGPLDALTLMIPQGCQDGSRPGPPARPPSLEKETAPARGGQAEAGGMCRLGAGTARRDNSPARSPFRHSGVSLICKPVPGIFMSCVALSGDPVERQVGHKRPAGAGSCLYG